MISEKDVSAAMTYGSLIEEALHLAGYSIEIRQDQDCMSPYDGDCNSPAIWLSLGNGFTEYGADSLERFFDRVTPAWVSRHWRKICAAMGIDESRHDSDARADMDAYGGSLSEHRLELFRQDLENNRSESWGHGIDYLDGLRALYRLAGIPAETFQRNGYCQGDSVYGLIVMTPAWARLVGCPYAMPGKVDLAECERDMAAQADEYGAWAWGDCFGYSIEDAAGNDVDSCWGFIGTDPDKSGIMENIVDAINRDIAHKAKTRRASLKTWIKARVPLQVRAALLAGLPA